MPKRRTSFEIVEDKLITRAAQYLALQHTPNVTAAQAAR